ncbi:unnamed protein product [Prunus brigantina]
MRGLWHGSKINMSLAPKRKIWLPREKWECLSRDFWELKAPFPAAVSVGDFYSQPSPSFLSFLFPWPGLMGE